MNSIREFSEAFYQNTVELFGQMTVIAGMILLAGFVLKLWQGGMGDVGAMIRAFITMGVIALAIPSLPGWVDQLQSSAHQIVGENGLNASPKDTHRRFAEHLLRSEEEKGEYTFWDLWGADSVSLGEVFLYLIILCASYAAMVTMYVISLGQQALLGFFVALSPVFLSFFTLGATYGTAVKFFLRLVSVILWPWGFALCSLITDSILAQLAEDGLVGINVPGAFVESSLYLFGTLVAAFWIVASTIFAPFVISKVFMEGASAGSEILRSFGAAATQTLTYGVGAGVTTRLLGGSRLAATASGLLGAGSGMVSGATGSSGAILPAAIGIGAAMSSSDNKDTNWSERARELRNNSK